MTKETYIKQLRGLLKGLPEDEIESAVIYCEEFYEEAESDAEAYRQLGSPASFSRNVIGNSIGKVIEKEAPNKKSNAKNWWLLILGILSLPISLPLLIVVFVLLFVVIILFISLIVTALAFFVASIVTLASGVVGISSDLGGGLFVMATSIGVIGLSFIVISIASMGFTKFIPWVAKKVRGITAKKQEEID